MLRIVIIVLFVFLGVCQDVLADSSKCGYPPRIRNGYPDFGDRVDEEKIHGTIVTYKCRDDRRLVEKGKVVCQFGKWEGEPPECMDNSCSIPDIENAEIGQFQTNYVDRSHEEFKKFPAGQLVNESETLYLRCQNGFFPTDNSVIYFTNRIEMRCNAGMWSKLLQCKAAPCLGEPPKMHNGYPVIHNREHGYIVSYMCDNNDRAVKSDVKCQFGSWIGNAPKCLEGFCYVPDFKHGKMRQLQGQTSKWHAEYEYKELPTGSRVNHNEKVVLRCDKDFLPTDDSQTFENDELEVTCTDGTWSKNFSCKQDLCNINKLNYPGLEKPSGVLLGSLESLTIICKDGFRKSSTKKIIRCVKGKWDILEDPCPEEITCPEFSPNNGLSILYQNFNRVGSWAIFSCQSQNRILVGEVYSLCQDDGTWSKPQPYCQDLYPELRCSIHELAMSVSEDVVLDMTDVTVEFMPLGSEMRLECKNNLIAKGTSKATCRDNGRWEVRSFQCVP